MVGLCASKLTDGILNLVSVDYKQKQNKIVITDIQANQINDVFFLPMSDKSGLVVCPVCISFTFLWHLTIFRQMTIVRYVILVCCLLIYATIVFFSTQTAEVEFRLEHNF